MSARKQSSKRERRKTLLSEKNRTNFIHCWNNQCGACGKTFKVIRYGDGTVKYMCELDHFVALKNNGQDSLCNLWPLCFECHGEKSYAESRTKFGGAYCIICKKFGNHETCFKDRKSKAFCQEAFDNLTKVLPDPVPMELDEIPSIPCGKFDFSKYIYVEESIKPN